MKNRKKIIILTLILITILITYGIIYMKNDKMIAVLGYHGVLPTEERKNNDNLVIEKSKFESQLKLLKKLNYKTLTLEEFLCWKKGECKKPHKSVLITFDDGYLNNYTYAFELLKKYDMNAIVFYIGSLSESSDGIYMSLEDIEKAKKEYKNIEFASHTYNLHNHDEKTYEIVNNDIKEMDKVLETKYFAYPYGDYNEDYINALKDNGYELAFTFGPKKEHRKAKISDDNFKLPRLNISNDMPMWKFLLRLLLPI